MEELKGTVTDVIYSGSGNFFCVFKIRTQNPGRGITVAGPVETPCAGEKVTMWGCWQKHPRFGMQFRAVRMQREKPDESEGIEKFLGSGMIDGIGPALARRIIDCFGNRTLDVMDHHMEALLEVPGIGEKTWQKIKESYENTAALHELVLFLQTAGIPGRFAAVIRQAYGEDAWDVIKTMPYRMIGEIPGIGFHAVDRIAREEGILPDDEDRIEEGFRYILAQSSGEGHCCIPEENLYHDTALLLHVGEDRIRAVGSDILSAGLFPSAIYKRCRYIYLPSLYEAETESAIHMNRLMNGNIQKTGALKAVIEQFEAHNGITLAEEQREAVSSIFFSPVTIITGGPGTGKTTLIKAVIAAADQWGLSVRLMAPTGRAAKRLAISSGRNADTIHKSLEAELRDEGVFFGKNASDPLDEKLIIVDEASMLDMAVLYRLLCAIRDGSRLVLVGDTQQLPPVGAGYPLRDLISWGRIPVTELRHIFRQQEGSGIVENAEKIRQGLCPVSDSRGEFQIREVSGEAEARELLLKLCRDMEYGSGDNQFSMQVLSPVYKGLCGVDSLNQSLQNMLRKPGDTALPYRIGDKVMQRINDYGKGIYNGDIGVVWAVTKDRIFVRFPEKELVYSRNEWGALQLAYAVTVHKSQGSEYETVFLILLPVHAIMLQRNLLYTAVTRAKKKVILITTHDALETAVRHHRDGERCSLFHAWLKEEIDPEYSETMS